MCKVEFTEFEDGVFYFPECPYADTVDVCIKDCRCVVLAHSYGSIGGHYWCSTAQKFDKCPMDVMNRV